MDSSGGLGKTGNSSLARLSHCTPISGRKSQTPASTISFFPYRASWGFIGLFFSLTQLSCYVTDISFQSLVISSFFF